MKKIELFDMITQLELRVSNLEKELLVLKNSTYRSPFILGGHCLVCGEKHPIGMQCPRYYMSGNTVVLKED